MWNRDNTLKEPIVKHKRKERGEGKGKYTLGVRIHKCFHKTEYNKVAAESYSLMIRLDVYPQEDTEMFLG